MVRGHVHAEHGFIVCVDGLDLADGSRRQDLGEAHVLRLVLDVVAKHVLGHVGCGGRSELAGVVSGAERGIKVESELVGRGSARGRRERVAGRRGGREAGARRRAGHGLAVHAKVVVHVESEIRLKLHCGGH